MADDQPVNERAVIRALNRAVDRNVARRNREERIIQNLAREDFSSSNDDSDEEGNEDSEDNYADNEASDYGDVDSESSDHNESLDPDSDLADGPNSDNNESDNTNVSNNDDSNGGPSDNNNNDSGDSSGGDISGDNHSDNDNGSSDGENIFNSSSDDSMGRDLNENSSDNSDGEPENQINFADPNERGEYLALTVRELALEGGVMSMRKLDKFLKRLHPLAPEHLPLSYKTLLGTPTTVEVTEIDGGCQFWYKGISTCLNKLVLAEYLQLHNRIKIDVNMDGLPLFKRSKVQFWPILGKLVGSKNEPFVIAIFCGKRAPTAHELLTEYVNEVNLLQHHGFPYNGRNYPVEIRDYICDALARAKVKKIIEPGGYSACEKCEVVGEWISNRMTYVNIDARLRTEDSFRNQTQRRHHTGISPLLDIEAFQPVGQFRLDTLHLVYLGVWRRLLLVWMKWNGPWKLRINVLQEISLKMEVLAESCPSDFNRPPRAILDIKFWAGTEFRRSLLYDGVLVFRDSLHPNVYSHFLFLHCALVILNCPIKYQTHNNIANELLRTFISHSVRIYGAKFVVYNVHNLSHLAQECLLHGPSDSFSGFPYENKLGAIKKSLKSGYKPLQQAAYRDLEKEESVVILSHQNGPVKVARTHQVDGEIIDGIYFKYLSVNGIEIKLNQKDFCIRTSTGEVLKVSNIVMRENEIFLVGNVFQNTNYLYVNPIPSSNLGILAVSDLKEERQAFPLTDVKAKCWLMPDGDNYACFPLLHSPILF